MGKPATKEPPAGSSAVEPGPSEQPADAQQDKVVIPAVEGQVAQEELEEETCGFCKFMKAGPCGTVFKAWEACIDQHKEEGSDSYVDSCIDPSRMLKECMDQHQEYYNPVLAMDAADEEEAKKGESEAKEAGEDAPAEEAPREAVETPVKKHSEPSSPPPQ